MSPQALVDSALVERDVVGLPPAVPEVVLHASIHSHCSVLEARRAAEKPPIEVQRCARKDQHERPEPKIIYRDREPEPKAEEKKPEIATQRMAPKALPSMGPAQDGNEEYWASVLREKAELEIELNKLKDDLSSSSVDVVDVSKENNELLAQLDILKHEKEDIEREILYKEYLINNLSLELARLAVGVR